MFELMFWFGVAFVLISALLGQVIGEACCYSGGAGFSMSTLFQPMPVLLVILFTGGAGMLATPHLSTPWLLWALALGAGLVASYVLTRWVLAPIFNLENTSSTTQLEAYGTVFTLNRSLEPGQVISHGLNITGTYQDRLVALSPSELPLGRGTQVQVVSVKDHVLYVSRVGDPHVSS